MNLIASTSTFSFFTLISRILGYVRDILIAIFLGTSFFADAFFVAFRLPNTFRRLFAEGTFNAAFIPSYASELAQDKEQADHFARNVFNLLFIILLFFVLVAEIFMPQLIYLIAPGFYKDPQKLELAVDLSRITFPFLFFVCLASFFAAILNSYNKFAAAAAAPIILNVILIGSLFLSQRLNISDVTTLSYAVSFAGLLQLLILLFFVRKNFKPILTLKIKIDEKIKFFFHKLLPSIFSSGVTQINILVGTIIASFQSGAVSYLYYADRVYQINLAIAGIAIGTVILPQLSKYIQNNENEKIITIQNKALELSLFLSIPAAVALLIASEQIISALFGYGSFDEVGIKNSAKALFYFALGLPAFSLIKVFSSFFFARHNTKLPFYIALVSVLLNIIISVIFFQKIGFIIIPIATTISSWFNSILLFIFLKKENLFKFNLIFFSRFIRIIFSVIIMGFFFNYLIIFFEANLAYGQSYKSAYLVGLVLIGLISYMLIAVLIKAFKISDINLKY